MKIFVDSDFKCHATNPDGSFREVETRYTEFFAGKCETFIVGYCYDDSKEYVQIYPWKPYDELDAAQREYEKQLLAEYERLIPELDATIVDQEYRITLLELGLTEE